MKEERLRELLGRFGSLRIAVVGDLFLDKWFFINRNLDEPSVETGLMAYQVTRTQVSAGAAGTILNNLAALGIGTCLAVGFVGLDGDGWEVLHALQKRGVDTRYVLQSEAVRTPAYMKPMFLQPAGPAVESNRLDVKNLEATSKVLEEELLKNIQKAAKEADALIVLDQLDKEGTGVVTPNVRRELSKLARENPSLIVYADSRAFIHTFRDVIIKCNNLEAARMALGKASDAFSMDDVAAAMEVLKAQTGKEVFITCNQHGVAAHAGGRTFLVPAAKQNGEIDVCGAGDACTAGIVSALCAGADNREAAFLGNLTAGVTVRKIGTTGTASCEEVTALYREQFGEE